ncbi:MAG: HAD family phosphatase [Oscillospiraceae bacterium]|jgi:putative hydrolase of the HAD superfamily|nr:HAD family phosphatase [Oscillospiraceae bacterium]
MHQNIIFDMGGVLLDFSVQRLMDWFYGDLPAADQEAIRAAQYDSGLWSRMDRGDFDEEGMIAAICALLPERLHAPVRAMIPRYFEALTPLPATNALVRELKGMGQKLFLLTNAPYAFAREKWRIPTLDAFDGIFASYEVHMLKPDRAIYLAFLERFHLQAQDCFFVDDVQANIDGAAAVGITGHCFADRDIARLRQALGLPENT